MFKVDPRARFDAVSLNADGDDDNISLTSTVSGHDPDEEFSVENILAEVRSEDGKTYYLVEWTGFQLHESTWEPESNLGSDLKAMWEEDKEKHATGELQPFDVQKFYDARDKADEEKRERHRRRNAKRQRLGLPLTAPFDDKDSSEDEAVETRIDVDEAPQAAPASRQQNQQGNSRGVADSKSPTSAGSSQYRTEGRRPSIGSQEPQTANKRKQAPHPPTTGYQGTARRPSTTSADAATKPRTRPTVAIPAVAGAPPRPIPGNRKTLTAKKSTIQPTGNIFTSGRARKKKATLKEAMSDSTKEPRFFDRHRYRRLAELRGREKEDLAPDISKISQFIDLRSGQTISRQSSGASNLSPTQLSPHTEMPPQFVPRQASTTVNPSSILASPDAAPPKKKRKSVRFLEDDDDAPALVQEPEQMDLDTPATQGRARNLHSPPPRRGPSLDQTRGPPMARGSQNSDKKLVLGQFSVEVTFNGLPREPPTARAWLEDFLAKRTLEFRHACFAKTAAMKIASLIQEPLASGIIRFKDSEPALEQLAEYLATGLLALYYGQTEYNVLVYPTKCDEWKSIPLGQEPASPSEALLGYLIFGSPQDCQLLLPPLTPLSEFQPAPGVSKEIIDFGKSASARELIIKRLFGFDYTKLLPTLLRTTSDHNFFLAIPNSRRELGQALFHWLRACNPACRIFFSQHAGSWEAFRTRVDALPGVIIIHEMLAWSMRRFPHLSRYLIGCNDEYWCISEPVHGLPLYPSISIPEYTVPPGDMHLARLFPYRTAIFLTPSFLVSEPQRALEFLEWFSRNWVGRFHYRLVTAYNIHDYLSELAEERYQARQDLLSTPGDIQIDIEANLNRLSRDDCRCRYAAAEVAADLHIVRVAKAGEFGHDEDNSSLLYADPSIDPNDEQSLVNWFGWWATLRADQFRKFHVVGSSQAIKMHGSGRGERIIRIPKYSQVTLSDPDAVLEVLQERNDQVEASEADGDGSGINPQHSVGGNNGGGFEQGSWAFRSNLIRFEDSACFTAYLESLFTIGGFKSVWSVFKYPVSWLDFAMAEHFGDFTTRFPKIFDWFNFTSPFGPCYQDDGFSYKPPPSFNTYLGFFYTIDKEWDPEHLPPRKPVERHPWIAIYRPVNPHKKPFGRCELIIWDPAARTRYPSGRAPAEKDLIFMQRQVVEYVRDNGDAKNHGTWLDQMWFGGWNWPSECDAQYPIDVTLLFLRRMLENFRDFVPAPEHVMESKGWKRVRLGPASPSRGQGSRSPAADSTADSSLFVDQDPMAGAIPMDIDPPSPRIQSDERASPEEEDENTRIIFHPPRGHINPSSKRSRGPYQSKCVNRLYEEARLAKTRAAGERGGGAPPTHMVYRYPPTLDWYREQKAEGRGYAHVNVDSWEGVFNSLKINQSSRGEGKEAVEGGVAEGRRGESVGSG